MLFSKRKNLNCGRRQVNFNTKSLRRKVEEREDREGIKLVLSKRNEIREKNLGVLHISVC